MQCQNILKDPTLVFNIYELYNKKLSRKAGLFPPPHCDSPMAELSPQHPEPHWALSMDTSLSSISTLVASCWIVAVAAQPHAALGMLMRWVNVTWKSRGDFLKCVCFVYDVQTDRAVQILCPHFITSRLLIYLFCCSTIVNCFTIIKRNYNSMNEQDVKWKQSSSIPMTNHHIIHLGVTVLL